MGRKERRREGGREGRKEGRMDGARQTKTEPDKEKISRLGVN
jgi:hypothetical protein